MATTSLSEVPDLVLGTTWSETDRKIQFGSGPTGPLSALRGSSYLLVRGLDLSGEETLSKDLPADVGG
jgi:hypothetical protein